MEPQQQQPQQQQQQNEEGIGGSSNKSSFLCRQSTTRWTPTAEQIRILKDLYYNNGVRSPSAEQIQKISAKLRQYGKIEGKNVFYWFQNHKARERQKKRLTTEIPMQRSAAVWRSEDTPIYAKVPTFNSAGVPSPSPSTYGLHGFNQLGNYGYGSLAMEKSFRDCSISSGGNGSGSMVHNFMWAAATGVHDHHHHPYNPLVPSSSYPFHQLDKKKCYNIETQDDEEQDEEQDHDQVLPGRELETLPLFPMHEENHHINNDNINNIVSGNFCNVMKQETENYYNMTTTNWYHPDTTTNMGCSRASLELTLNSYSAAGCRSPNAP